MTEKKRQLPMKRATKSFKKIGGSAPVYRGSRPGTAACVRDAQERAPELASKLNGQELKFLESYYRRGTLAAAYKSLRKSVSDRSAYKRGSLVMSRIRAKLSDQELYELFGITQASISKVVREAMEATYVRDFVIPRTGEVITTEPRPDHNTRLEAGKFAAKLRRLTDEGANSGSGLVVNVVQYNPPGSPPWPGGGREGPMFPAMTVRNALPPATNIKGRDPGVRED